MDSGAGGRQGIGRSRVRDRYVRHGELVHLRSQCGDIRAASREPDHPESARIAPDHVQGLRSD
jgi:hypothetical protein